MSGSFNMNNISNSIKGEYQRVLLLNLRNNVSKIGLSILNCQVKLVLDLISVKVSGFHVSCFKEGCADVSG